MVARFYAGQPQVWINDTDTQYYAGINEYAPFTTGRSAIRAERKYHRWLHTAHRPVVQHTAGCRYSL